MRTSIVVPSLLAFALVFAGAGSAGVSDRQAANGLPRIARSLVEAGAPGAIVLVRGPAGVRSARAGFAKLRNLPMRAADHFRIGSVTKTFVATAVLQLAAERKLRLDDTIEHWLPGVVPNGDQITLRQLLNHTSGLFNYTDDAAFRNEVARHLGRHWTPSELLKIAFSHPPDFPPGTRWKYSNTGYILLGLVLQKATGKSAAAVLRNRLIKPLHLRATSFPTTRAIPPPIAHGYATLNGKQQDITSRLDPSWAFTAGEMVSSARDLSHFYAALLGGRLLAAQTLKQMETGSTANTQDGLGLLRVSTPCGTAFGYAGDIVGWHDEVLATPNGRRVVVLMVNFDATRLENHSPAAPFTLAPRALCSTLS